MNAPSMRSRPSVWFAAGAVLALLATLVVVNAWRVEADPGDQDTTFVPITPCRLFDTRDPGDVPFGPNVWRSFPAHGTNGDCAIPTTATGLSTNITAIGPTLLTFLTVYPDDEPRPVASSLNPAPGQPPTPNAVTTELSPGGRFRIYNKQGVVDVIVDINGYYVQSSLRELHQRVAALEARDPEVRVAHAESGNVDEALFGGTPNAHILTTTITTPGPGDLVIMGNAHLQGPALNRMRCEIDVNGTFLGGSVVYAKVDNVNSAVYDNHCTSTVTHPVTAGTYTVQLEVRDRLEFTDIDDAALWVIWVRS